MDSFRYHSISIFIVFLLVFSTPSLSYRASIQENKEEVVTTSSDRVDSLPRIGKLRTTTYSGFIEVEKEHGANLFYMFVESQSQPLKDPVILWLQGGPGCSSLFGEFVEIGPQLIDENGSFTHNQWSWNSNANLLFIDQPAGTGYSYVESPFGYVTNEKKLAEELYTAITGFFELHKEYAKLDFYIFGESYAGKYIPSLSSHILAQNGKNPPILIALKGLGMGDGWVDPYHQTGSYAPFLYHNGLIGIAEVEAANTAYESYKRLVDAELYFLADDAGALLLEGLALAAGNVDVYDIRYKGMDPTDAPAAALRIYLNEKSVREELHAGNQTWKMCSPAPEFALIKDLEQSVSNLLPSLLSNYQVLNYNGIFDLICNFFGTVEWTNLIEWPGRDAYVRAANQTWIVDGFEAGYFKYAGNLTHVVIYNAGHMAPFNQPQFTQDMLYRFIAGGFKKQL